MTQEATGQRLPAREKITILAPADPNETRGDKTKLVAEAVEVGVLREQFRKFMSSLQSFLDASDEGSHGFVLAEIQFAAELTVDGEFRLLGTGVGVQASSAITFVLQRKQTQGAT